MRGQATEIKGNSKHASEFLKATVTTLLHTVSESEKALYVTHINGYLRDDPFLKQFLPLDPATNDIFDLAKDGVLLWYCRTVHCEALHFFNSSQLKKFTCISSNNVSFFAFVQ